MKTIFRFSGLAVLVAAFGGFAATAAFAQDPCADADGQAALYTKFTELYPKTDLASRKEAVSTAKQFLEKYGACEPVKEQNDYFKTAIPAIEKLIKDEEARNELKALFARFDAAVSQQPTTTKPDEVFASGKELLAKQPENVNVMVAMALVGLSQSNAANSFKYTDDTLRYANMALSKIKGGAKFKKDPKTGEETIGAFWTDRTRPEALADLSYSIAYLTYFGKKDKQTALPLFYELSQTSHKDNPVIYGVVGDYYIEQRKPIGEQIRVKIAEQQKEGEAVEVKEAREEEIKKLVALFNGYNERILDAYSRAYKVTKDTPANKAYRDNLYKIMMDVYKSRFEKETGLNEYITATVAKPFPNPTSAVTPVSDPEPAKTTTGAAETAQPAGTNGKPATKPAPANGKTAVTTKPRR